jgi:hypothetical protein
VAAVFCLSLWAMLMVASKSIRSSVPGSGAAPASHARRRATARAARTPAKMGPVDPVQQPPRRGHRGHRPEQRVPVTQHLDPGHRIHPVGDRHRQVREHLARQVHRDAPVGV